MEKKMKGKETKSAKKGFGGHNVEKDLRFKKNLFFVIKFFVIFFALTTLANYFDLSEINGLITGFEANLLGLAYCGSKIFVGDGALIITNGCIGLISASILAAVIFSLSKPALKEKARIFLIGFAVLFPLNLARIYLVLLSGKAYGVEIADLVHTISWFVATALIMLVWYYTSVKVTKRKVEELL